MFVLVNYENVYDANFYVSSTSTPLNSKKCDYNLYG